MNSDGETSPKQPNMGWRTKASPSRSKSKCLRKSASVAGERAARLFSVAETYKKGGVGLRITLKINEQTAVNAIETC